MNIRAVKTIEMDISKDRRLKYIVESDCGYRIFMAAGRTRTLEQRIEKLMGKNHKYPVTIFNVVHKEEV